MKFTGHSVPQSSANSTWACTTSINTSWMHHFSGHGDVDRRQCIYVVEIVFFCFPADHLYPDSTLRFTAFVKHNPQKVWSRVESV